MGADITHEWAEVVVDVRVSSVDRIFHYAVPPHLRSKIAVGHRVMVPFGRRRRVEGYVIGLPQTEPAVDGLREIETILDDDPCFSAGDVAVAHWMAEHYMCLMAQALQCFLPPGRSTRRARPVTALYESAYALTVPAEKALELARQLTRRAPRQAQVLETLARTPGHVRPSSVLAAECGYDPLRVLAQRGWIEQRQLLRRRRPDGGLAASDKEYVLTDAQRKAVEMATNALDASTGEVHTLLLHGVTGSGKTEVYLQIIARVLSRGKGAILLVPDISLTPQTLGRFQARFGDRVAVLHSRLSEGERYDEWVRIRRGEAPVVVGARSAVFAPVQNLGVIIIDEEHETSYKQDETPRYHAREVAYRRIAQQGGLLLLGSATPSLEAYHRAQTGQSLYATLPERVGGRPLPTTDVVDMREELLTGNRSMFSRALQGALSDTLRRGEQAILLINRRGFATFLLCRECGFVPRCELCGVSLTLHENPPRMRCHYCGYDAPPPERCPQCTGRYLRPFGAGTQRVEKSLAELFPEARIARMDRDTMVCKDAHRRLLARFQAGEIDCLVGTQMVAKGLDFPAVTLVGVVSADTALHFPDFRAAERTFQLLTQVAGRAGRGEKPGQVILQTYSPEHYAIQAASRHDYEGFVRAELAFRRRTGYPPFAKLVRILLSGEDEHEVARTAGGLAQVHVPEGVRMIGPSPAPLSRLRGKSRWHVLLRGEPGGVKLCVERCLAHLSEKSAVVAVSVDVDPLSLL